MTNTILDPRQRHQNTMRCNPSGQRNPDNNAQNKPVYRSPIYSNIKTEDHQFIIQLAIPGYKKEDVKIELNDQTLKITGTVAPSSNVKFLRKEFAFDTFERSFNLPKNIIVDSISAAFDQGILHVFIPKVPKEGPKVISVK